MIEVNHLSKQYGNHLALNDVTFKVKEGEILGLLGPNGAGKTTTMRILTGFMPPTSGNATIAGFDIQKESMQARAQVGYMPEQIPIYPDMTVEGYVTFWAKARGLKKPKSRVLEVLEMVQLAERRKSLVRSLSKGMRQRLGLAQALVHDPKVVILDEPTIGIDPQQVIEVRDNIYALAETHTVIFSTHILSEAEKICDRVVILNQGEIIAQGTPEALRRKLQPWSHIFVEVSGADDKKIEKILNKVPGNNTVQPQVGGFSIRANDGSDIRKRLFDTLKDTNLTILEMRPVATTLEDIFLEVVGGEGQA